MAHFIAELRDKGYAYATDDGSYYFRIAKFPEYGKLSKKDFAGMTDGARVDVDEYEKDNARDFALWKAPKPGEAQWDTEIGPGRPGWHIECSQMSMKYLGDSFDIHAGGEDLIFPHHENEIAQSEALTGKPFVRFWIHSRFLLVEGEKMAKSAGNFYTVRDLVLMGHKPSSIRFLLMSVPHHKQLNFTFDGLTQAANSVERLRNFKRRLQTSSLPRARIQRSRSWRIAASTEMRAGMEDDLEYRPRIGSRLRSGAGRKCRDGWRTGEAGRRSRNPEGSRSVRRDFRRAEQMTTRPRCGRRSNGPRPKVRQTKSVRRRRRSQKRRLCRTQTSRSWWRNIRRRASRGISRARMRFGINSRRTESFWRTLRKVCAGSASSRPVASSQLSEKQKRPTI